MGKTKSFVFLIFLKFHLPLALPRQGEGGRGRRGGGGGEVAGAHVHRALLRWSECTGGGTPTCTHVVMLTSVLKNCFARLQNLESKKSETLEFKFRKLNVLHFQVAAVHFAFPR